MKKEFKLKAWDIPCNTMREWKWIKNCEFPFLSSETGNDLLKKDHFILFESTGLKDKNDKELYYDSDLVILKGHTGEWIATKDDFDIPVFKRNNDSFELIQFSDYFLDINMSRNGFEIVGNIHENK